MQAAMDTAPCKCFTDRAVRACLERWGLHDEIKAVRVRYDRKGKDEELVKGILTDEVRTALGMPVADDDAAVRVERLKCEATTLSIFDPFAASQDIILGSGRAKQCPQVVIGGVECDNALRKWLARKKYDRDVAAGARDREEEDDDERPSVALEDDELLYRLFELLCLGGPLAQPDLELAPVWKSTSVSGAPDNSSLSHFSAMAWPRWFRRAARNRHRHAIEQASRRWRGGRRCDSERVVKF